MNSRPRVILALAILLFVLGNPSQVIALGTLSIPATNDSLNVQSASQSQLTRAPLFFHIVNANSGASIPGALVWFDGFLAGSADSFGVLGISVTHPSSSHNYLVSASGYRVERGTITFVANSDGHLTIRLMPSASRE